MRAVFEDVEDGHGGVAEAVNEEGFELAFEEVKSDECAGEELEGGGGGRGGGVYCAPEEVEEGVNEERAGVFDDEDGAPGNLRA